MKNEGRDPEPRNRSTGAEAIAPICRFVGTPFQDPSDTGSPVHFFWPTLRLFLALSRTTHGLLDLAAPALAALLWLGTLPAPSIAILGLITAFAGYTAVYALNDLVDYRVDRLRVESVSFRDDIAYLDRVFVHHPVAQGLLGFRAGLLWTLGWAIVAAIGAWVLNPLCAVLFLAGVVLEATYCLMLGVTHLRVFVSGIVKTLGPVAAVLAVDPAPSLLFLVALFVWLFCWEVGGQNMPADWFDLEEDRDLKVRTVAVRLGETGTSRIVLLAIAMAVLLNPIVLASGHTGYPLFIGAGSAIAGLYLLVVPAIHAYRTRTTAAVGALFGKASFYPLAILVFVLIGKTIAGLGG